MHVSSKWKSLLILKKYICPSSSLDSHYYAYFHSTTATLAAKWNNNKWNDDPGRAQRPTKISVRFEVRQKRTDSKKALNDLLFSSGCSTLPFQNSTSTWETEEPSTWDAVEPDSSKKQSRSKKSRRSPPRAKKGNRRQKKFSSDSDSDSQNVFQARFGNRYYTRSFRNSEEPSFQTSSAEFEWRDRSSWTGNRRKVWDSASDIDDEDDDDKSCMAGSYSDRTVLGLPPTGPLKIDAVKTAFRSSALKWHPDKHQGPSQAQAEQKFKQCVDAYKALCNALPSK
ncbi:hypothetical protein IFM89_014278 [Coptis chinensis]|uniref:J domain-containing protein n=1 Tax=Coptis chinensis TaxID=261450 RepID=A0A835H5W6_9MAGN|nr:hypothetical protein IFM89_014278 [Coptis chinensis]